MMSLFKKLFCLLLIVGCASLGGNYKEVAKEDFHLYLLIGQSNMAGRGAIEAIDTLVHPRVFALDSLMRWKPAKDPLHFDKSIAGTGLGLTFGKTMAAANPRAKIGLIPCAKGGSSINQWFRDSLHKQTNSYPYNEMVVRTKTAMKTGTLKGILWHQGESDSESRKAIDGYSSKFNAMIDSLQKDLGIVDVPIIIGELGHFRYASKPLSKRLNHVFAEIANSSRRIRLATGEGLGHKGDGTHFDSKSLRTFGERYANELQKIK
ncbi:MAG: sialate O-acetylesterase [Flavobacteriaceae bacterium]